MTCSASPTKTRSASTSRASARSFDHWKVVGTGAATTIGLSINANRVKIDADVDLFPTDIQRYGHGSIVRLTATNCPASAYYEPDGTADGNDIIVNVITTSGSHKSWTLPTTLGRNLYRMISTGRLRGPCTTTDWTTAG